MKSSTLKPVNSGCSGISGKWNISDASLGTEELGHVEIVSAIVAQLTRNLTIDEIEKSGYEAYFTQHTTGVYPCSPSGEPFNAATFAVKGDVFADLNEDLAAEQRQEWFMRICCDR